MPIKKTPHRMEQQQQRDSAISQQFLLWHSTSDALVRLKKRRRNWLVTHRLLTSLTHWGLYLESGPSTFSHSQMDRPKRFATVGYIFKLVGLKKYAKKKENVPSFTNLCILLFSLAIHQLRWYTLILGLYPRTFFYELIRNVVVWESW